jgi:hypothetical protein
VGRGGVSRYGLAVGRWLGEDSGLDVLGLIGVRGSAQFGGGSCNLHGKEVLVGMDGGYGCVS